MSLPDWLARRSVAVLSAMAGAEPAWPWDAKPDPEPLPDDIVAEAERYLMEHSAMRDEGVVSDG